MEIKPGDLQTISSSAVSSQNRALLGGPYWTEDSHFRIHPEMESIRRSQIPGASLSGGFPHVA
jgi:hypothetical protein